MPISHAIVLGLVQGLSEFLPISSSGHLLLVPWLFGWDDFDSESTEKAFDVALHIGTLIAAIVYFRHDLVVYVREGARVVFQRRSPVTRDGRLAWLLLLSTVPAAAVGAVFEDQIDEGLGTPAIIAVSFILGGLLLEWADRTSGTRVIEEFSVRDAVVIGAAQALALNPGTSRSGITMTAGRFSHFDRDAAVRDQLPDDDSGDGRGRVVEGDRLGRRRDPRGPGRADGRRHHHVGHFGLDRRLGPVAPRPHAQLHPVRRLPRRRRRRRARGPRDGLAVSLTAPASA